MQIKIILILSGIIVLGTIIAILRNNFKRNRLSNDNGGVKPLRESINRTRETNNDLRESTEKLRDNNRESRETTEHIRSTNSSAREGIVSAREILERAKKRNSMD